MSTLRLLHSLALTAVLTALPLSASAQSTVPDDIRDRLLQIGFASPYAASDSIYLPLLARASKGGVTITKDLEYGPHARNLLDTYRPDGANAAPSLGYIHGGGYRAGDRDINEEIYANVLHYFTRYGLVGVNATYRLAPEASWPSGAEDMREIIRWVKAHATELGGDPDRVFMMGHSAGATHVATYAFDPRFQLAEGHGLAGIVLVSGRYVIKDDPDDPSLDGIRMYFGSDPAAYPSRSSMTHVPGSNTPALLAIAEYDQRNLVETTGELFVALCDRDGGRCPRLIQLPYHNHMTELAHFNTEDDLFGREILEFIHEGADRQRANARAR